jgi:hypothetical protein
VATVPVVVVGPDVREVESSEPSREGGGRKFRPGRLVAEREGIVEVLAEGRDPPFELCFAPPGGCCLLAEARKRRALDQGRVG